MTTTDIDQQPSKRSWSSVVLIIMLVSISIGCDQASKEVARSEIAPKEWVDVVPPVFSLTNVENTGAFLGMGSELGRMRPFVMIWLPTIALLVIFGAILLGKDMSRNQRFIMAMVVGGGLGNLIDRIRFGSVTDFMFLDFGVFRTGIFNVADLLITTGLVLLLFTSFKRKQPS